jgi:PTH2 family peptidyl-tRNA hydrolase
MKQVIIARKDLNLSPGKLAAQCSHASMAFLSHMIREHSDIQKIHCYPAKRYDDTQIPVPMQYKRADLTEWAKEAFDAGKNEFYAKPVDPNNPCGELELCEPDHKYYCDMEIDRELYDNWLNGIFTKIVCEAKNYNALMKAVRIANELGLQENKDYFLIKDCCLTELTPEEYDENGVGRTLTCIGFRPLPDDIAAQISKKFQLYK